ncbi:hypothetical protein [Vogesella indigofera]|uniref:hypothetical protein n=1 Tax=Vogesella indigofera TaxID=45465 RepID=UPI0035B0E84C
MAEKLNPPPQSRKVGRNRHAVAAFCFLAAPLVVHTGAELVPRGAVAVQNNRRKIKNPLKTMGLWLARPLLNEW